MNDGGDPVLTQPAPAFGPASLVGQVIGGRYRVESLLGEGGMGAVYRAEHIQLQKLVALKILHPEMTARPEAVARFEREAIVSARIQHPHVVNATDFGKLEDGAFYLVLEYVSGQSLRQLITEQGALAPALALGIAVQIADALVAAHDAGIVHRDLKPENVMLLGREEGVGFVKVLDFGIAKLSSGRSGEALTRHGAIFGTPEYMSPEQARGDRVDARTDLYALGIILYELLSGSAPFSAAEVVAVLIRQINEAPAPLPKSVPRELAAFVAELLEKEAGNRPQTAAMVAARLRTLQTAFPTFDAVSQPPSAVVRTQQVPIALVRQGMTRVSERVKSGVARAWPRALSALRKSATWTWTALTGVALLVRRDRRARWVALVAAVVPLLVTLLFLLPRHGDKEPISLARVFAAPLVDDNVRDAEAGKPEALEALSAIQPAKRGKEVWLALAAGHRKRGEGARAFEIVQAALAAEPELASEPSYLNIVRDAAEEPATRDAAIELAAKGLGAGGVDVLFDIWYATPGKTPATRAAKKWLDEPAVRDKASPALSLAFEIRETRGCDAMSRLLPRLAQEADERSLRSLQRLRSRTGCGLLQLQDCYTCLRSGDEIDKAIEQVGARPAPRFERTTLAPVSEAQRE